MATINGTSGNDTIFATSAFDEVFAGDGDDKVLGGSKAETLHGGNGNDTIWSGSGDDVIYGDADNDKLAGWNGNDTIYGGEGSDTIYGDNGDDSLMGNEGNDTITGYYGNDTLQGGAGSDYMRGDDGTDTIIHVVADNEGDNDTYSGGNGNDTLEILLKWYEANAMQDDLDALEAHIQAGRGDYLTLSDLGIRVKEFETLNTEVDNLIDFEELSSNFFATKITSTVEGLDWSGFFFWGKESTQPAWYNEAAVSGTEAVYAKGDDAEEDSFSSASGDSFDFESVYMTIVNDSQNQNPSNEVTIEGYEDGVKVGEQVVSLTPETATFVSLDDNVFDSVDEVVFSSDAVRIALDDLMIF